jgi:hypothetical protein
VRGSQNANAPTDGYILIQVRPGSEVSALAASVTQIPGVLKAEHVQGAYDVIATVREPNQHSLSPAERAIGELEGVLRAIPLAAGSGVATSANSDGEAA